VRGRWQGPLVTVVVAISDEETFRVAPCLMSLRVQTHSNIDVRVVPYGAAERAVSVAREQMAEDWRIRLEAPAVDRAAAWNSGAARSRAPYVVFARGGDDFPRHAIERLATGLAESGSDMAVGRIEPPFTLHSSVDSPYEVAHQTELLGTTLGAAPVAVTDLGVGNRMLRLDFWRRAGLAFDSDDEHGVDLALATYTRAASFDLMTDASYIPSGRREGLSVGAVRDVLSELETWLVEHDETREHIAALGVPDVRDWWLWGVLDAAIQPFIGDIERATPEQWVMLREHVQRLVDSGGSSAWESLRADSRIKLWLVLHDLRTELEEYIERRLFDRSHRPTVVRDGRVFAQLPFYGDARLAIPEDDYEMREDETALWASLQGIRWASPERLELKVFTRIEHVDLDEDPIIRAWFVERGGSARGPLDVDQYVDPFANLVSGSRYQDFSRGAVDLAISTEDLARRASEVGREVAWTLELEITAAGLTRRGTLSEIDDRGSAGMIETGHLGARTVAGASVGTRGRTAARFTVFAAPAGDLPELVSVETTGGTVRATLRPGSRGITAVRLVSSSAPTIKARVEQRSGLVEFVAEFPRRRPLDQPRRFAVLAVVPGQGEVPVTWPAGAPQWLGTGTADMAMSRSETGHADVLDATTTLIVEDVRLEGDQIEVDARWLGTPPRDYTVSLVRPARGLMAGEAKQSGPDVRLTFPTDWDEWGLGETGVPSGRYLFDLDCGRALGRVLLGEELLDRLLDFTVTDRFRFRPVRQGREAGLTLMPPIVDADRGQRAQVRLQQWFRSCDLPIDEQAVYLQSYAGASATDSQLAIFHELRRTRPELTVYWGVADSASAVPEGATRLLMHSGDWYRVLATARYLCLNIDPDRWFVLRPGQQLLQTFHGYPAKSMGIRMWEAKGYTPRRVELELDRTSRGWSMILTPAPEMDEYYRREYRYDGPIHSAGYPRDDLLVSPEGERVREETRKRLGILPEQRAVLFAPTWRDDLATNWRQAELITNLDVEAASRRLGPEYVLLMRGHRFHSGSTAGSDASARLIDVTNYPEINDLILASDAAILDYSSLRFDFALTRRPMVFLVPDLSTYTGGVRGFLYPFEDSAPGPLATSADEVIARLRDFDGLRREYADAIERFHETYNYLQDGHAAERVVEAFFG